MPGHLEKISKNSWTIVIELGRDPLNNNKRKRLKRAFRGTKKEAEKEMARLITEIETGTYVKPSKMTVAEYLSWWLNIYCRPKLRPRTYDSYEMICKKHFIPALGIIPLQKLHQMHLQQYITDKLDRGRVDGKGGLAPRTVQYHHRVFNKALAFAVDNKILAYNVARDVHPPKPKKKEMWALSAEEVQQLLETAAGHRDYLIVYTAVHTGMRRGEILGLKWQDVDLSGRVAQVQRTLQVKEGEFVWGPPKGGHGRSVPLPESLCALLREHKKRQIANLQGLIFTDPNGSPVNPGNLSHRFSNLAAKAGFKGLRFHDLRHTFATLALAAGVHPKIVQEILGHSSITVTIDTYSHALPPMYRKATDIVEGLISGRQDGAQLVPISNKNTSSRPMATR